jgi:lipopolysaccharide transport system ATP-binding protein
VGDPAVIFEGVWKKFRRGERHDSLRDLLPAIARRIVRGRRGDELEAEEFWAVRDVSFEVRAGDALGIIGPNGAGKSTVLKLLTRILRPTRGRCEVRGRVGALIEVSAGFHQDLTGRENVYLQGAIMGMKRAEIARKFDEIVEFAGVADFIDTPVKRYSSGMNARLGFAIAAHLDPEVLLIDEVLSVGDMAFQERCLERMRKFRDEGIPIIFVSHNLEAVRRLCTRALYLRQRVCEAGPAESVISSYVRAISTHSAGEGDAAIEIVAGKPEDEHGRPIDVVLPGARLRLAVSYTARRQTADVTLGFVVYRASDHLLVYDGNVLATTVGVSVFEPGATWAVEFEFGLPLTRGQYYIECHAWHNPSHRYISRLRPAAIVSVDERAAHGGIADLNLSCRLLTPAGAKPEA